MHIKQVSSNGLINKSSVEAKKEKMNKSTQQIKLINELIKVFKAKYHEIDIYEKRKIGVNKRRTQMQYTNLKHLSFALARSDALYHVYFKKHSRSRRAFINKALVAFIESKLKFKKYALLVAQF